jgi:hypothetical protein
VRRLFWVAVGAGAGVYVMRKLGRAREAASTAGISRGLTAVADSVRYFADEVRAGMSEREHELREALGLNDAERQLERSGDGHRPAGGYDPDDLPDARRGAR